MAQRLAITMFLLAATALRSAPDARPLTAAEKRGRQIYRTGKTSAGAEVTAFLGNPPSEVAGSLLPCVNCHGEDGRGRPEGGVTPTAIDWSTLAKPYGVTHENGRRHPAYTDETFARAVTAGIDPAGNRLNPVMPKYAMPAADLEDLLGYIKQIGQDFDPGITGDKIAVGLLLPPAGAMPDAGKVLGAVLSAYFDDINGRGGVYGRSLELRAVHCGETADTSRLALERFIAANEPFAMVAPFIAGAERELLPVLETAEIPVIGPFTLHPDAGSAADSRVFYLVAGVRQEALALVRSTGPKPRAATGSSLNIAYRAGAEWAAIAQAADAAARAAGWSTVSRTQLGAKSIDAGAFAQEAKRNGVGAVLVLADGAVAAALANAAAVMDYRPDILMPASLAGKGIFAVPASFGGRLFVSFPVLPSDQDPQIAAEYAAFARSHGIGADRAAITTAAYAAARLFVHELMRTGREVTRRKLVAALEGTYRFNSGLTPPLTFGPNRRLGSTGAHVVEFKPASGEFVRPGEWIEVGP